MVLTKGDAYVLIRFIQGNAVNYTATYSILRGWIKGTVHAFCIRHNSTLFESHDSYSTLSTHIAHFSSHMTHTAHFSTWFTQAAVT